MCDCGLVFVFGGGVCSATLLEVVRAFKHSHTIYGGNLSRVCVSMVRVF